MSTEAAGGKKYGATVKIAVCLLIFIQMTQAFCNPSLALIMQDFPGESVTTLQTIINIPTLVMIVSALITGMLAKKIGFKSTAIIAGIFALVGGVLPGFVHPSVMVMIVERGIFGIGYGMTYALSIAACGEFWRGKETTKMVGIVIFCAGLSGIVYNLACAGLANLGHWEYFYYAYFIIVPIMIYIAIFLPQRSELAVEEPLPEMEKPKSGFSGLGTKFWAFIVGYAIALIAVAAFMNNISMIVIGTGIDSTGAAVGIIMTGFTAGMMVGGAVYPVLYRVLKRAHMPVVLLIDVICFIVIMVAASYITLIVCAILIGIVFGVLNASSGDMANKKVVDFPAASANGASISITASGLAQFASPFVLAAMAMLFGQSEANVFYQYYPAVAIIAVGVVLLFIMVVIRKNKVEYERD